MFSRLVIFPWAFLGLTRIAIIASAFQVHLPSSIASKRRVISCTKLDYSSAAVVDIAEGAPRDVLSLSDWSANYGVQTSDYFQLISEDGLDVLAITNQDLPDGSPILCIPNELILTGSKARQEFGADAYGAEQMLMNSESSDQFYLFMKVMKEYELGDQSPWYAWLNSLPRYYSNGASMTDFCFGCLPPYAAELALAEKTRLNQFVEALSAVPFLSSESKSNADLARWAFAVVHTRYLEMPDGGICLVPMADFFNHGGAETDVYISYDEQGNCYAYSTRDVPAGQPLRICYGDPTNPSNLLARFGFLDESSPGTFCKITIDNPSPELINMGYPSLMLFYNDGSISQEVWDILLYEELGKSSEEQQAFYRAYMTGDEASKQSYHEQYFPKTLSVLQKHVDYLMNELDELSENSWRKDVKRHPRLPLLMRHNEFVRNTLELVQQNLDNISLA
mmetsp:Transcript_2760/g.5002  ORF Transcript_2760/g.5002 Transcript_2760/m.5002 type:complete len:450 (-) Transcript_2760:130-1479(-)